jgi:hypothetical protein
MALKTSGYVPRVDNLSNPGWGATTPCRIRGPIVALMRGARAMKEGR